MSGSRIVEGADEDVDIGGGIGGQGRGVGEGVEMGLSSLVLVGEPDLITSDERCIQQERVVGREDDLGSVRVVLVD